MYEVSAVDSERRFAWLWHLPLLLAAAGMVGGTFLPWGYEWRPAPDICTDFCGQEFEIAGIAGKNLPFGSEILTLGVVLALHGVFLARRRGRGFEMIKLAALGLALALQLIIYRIFHQLGGVPRHQMGDDRPWGYYLFIAGTALLAIALVLRGWRLSQAPAEAPPAAQVAPLTATD